MMLRHLSATGLMTILTLAPMAAHAYVTPDEALDDESYTTRFYDVPPSTREVHDMVEQQRITSEERRNAEQEALKPKPEPTEEELHGAAPEEEADETDIDKLIELIQLLQNSSAASSASSAAQVPSGLDPVTQRLLLRLEAQQDAAARQDFIQGLLEEDGEVLHSGAPLSETGPATVLVTLAVAGAIGETWRRAKKSEAQTQSMN